MLNHDDANVSAYLSVETIRRFREHDPHAQPDDVAGAYLKHVPEQTVSDSCLFHGERGCTLPRDIRSRTCNNFLCDHLQELRERVNAGAPPRAFFVSVEELHIVATEFVDAARP